MTLSLLTKRSYPYRTSPRKENGNTQSRPLHSATVVGNEQLGLEQQIVVTLSEKENDFFNLGRSKMVDMMVHLSRGTENRDRDQNDFEMRGLVLDTGRLWGRL